MIGQVGAALPRTLGARRWFDATLAFVRSSWLNRLGSVIVLVAALVAFVGPLVAQSPSAANLFSVLAPPSPDHFFGTDSVGRDVLSRVIAGARISLSSAALIVALSVTFGSLLGITAGLVGGLVDEVLMRVTDLFFAFPAFVLAAAIAATLGPSLEHTIIAVAVVFWPWYTRLARSQVLSLREREFVLAARLAGCGTVSIVFRHMVPNVVPVIAVQVSADLGNAILSISALSFLGLGAQPPAPEWGTMMASARDYLQDAWWFLTFPGLALLLTVFGFNLLGDGLRDWSDPRRRTRARKETT